MCERLVDVDRSLPRALHLQGAAHLRVAQVPYHGVVEASMQGVRVLMNKDSLRGARLGREQRRLTIAAERGPNDCCELFAKSSCMVPNGADGGPRSYVFLSTPTHCVRFIRFLIDDYRVLSPRVQTRSLLAMVPQLSGAHDAHAPPERRTQTNVQHTEKTNYF